MKTTEFIVRSRGEFPVDMLRYDACWPKSSDDAIAIAKSFDYRRNGDPRNVTLLTCLPNRPTTGRWTSFGWKVL